MKYKSSKDTTTTIIKEDYSKSIIFGLEDLPSGGHLLQTVIIPPQTKQREHFHHKQTEIFYILEGRCSIFINNKEFIVEPGDSFVCEPEDKHYLWNTTDEDFKLLVFKINKPEDDDTEWI